MRGRLATASVKRGRYRCLTVLLSGVAVDLMPDPVRRAWAQWQIRIKIVGNGLEYRVESPTEGNERVEWEDQFVRS